MRPRLRPAPGGFEQFFIDLAQLAEITPQAVAALEEKYGSFRKEDLPA